jgi:HK97 family phage prohead protease
MELKYKNFNVELKEINEEEHTISAVFSTADVDRSEEVIDQKGWILDEYLTNPVILFAHDHYQPAVAKTISIGINSKNELEGVVKFAVEEYPFAQILFNLYKGGYMRAFSVGFSNIENEVVDDVMILKKNKLYEISVVNVGANAMALAKNSLAEARAKGLDTSALDKFIEDVESNKEKANLNKDIPVKEEQKPREIKKRKIKRISNNVRVARLSLKALENLLDDSDQVCAQKKRVVVSPENGRRNRVSYLLNKAMRSLIKAKSNL